MNSSVNSSLGYSPFEIVFSQRPKFPLAPQHAQLQLETLPKDLHSYMRSKSKKLEFIREIVLENATKAKGKMLDVANAKIRPLQVQSGDYVYLHGGLGGAGQKLKPQSTGPFVVDKVTSPHTVLLRNPQTGRPQQKPVHLDRLTMAYVREPNPCPYFLDEVVTRAKGAPGEERRKETPLTDRTSGRSADPQPAQQAPPLSSSIPADQVHSSSLSGPRTCQSR